MIVFFAAIGITASVQLPERPVTESVAGPPGPVPAEAGPWSRATAGARSPSTTAGAGRGQPGPSAAPPTTAVAGSAGHRSTGPGHRRRSMGDYRMALVAAVNVDLPNQHPTVVLREIGVTPTAALLLDRLPGRRGAVPRHAEDPHPPSPDPRTHEPGPPGLRHRRGGGAVGRPPGRRLLRRAGPPGPDRVGRCSRVDRPTVSPWPSSSRCSVPILIDRRLFEHGRRRDPTGTGRVRPTRAEGGPDGAVAPTPR